MAVSLGVIMLKSINFNGTDQQFNGAYGAFNAADLIKYRGIVIALLEAFPSE